MPTLTLISLFNAQKSIYVSQLVRARDELERFKEDLVSGSVRRQRMQSRWEGSGRRT